MVKYFYTKKALREIFFTEKLPKILKMVALETIFVLIFIIAFALSWLVKLQFFLELEFYFYNNIFKFIKILLKSHDL